MGGEETIKRIVEAFYPIVLRHPEIASLFPQDIEPVMEKQMLFLTQFFGGPALYSDQYGHPMMRARHMSIEITDTRAKAWLACMEQAMREIGLEEELIHVLIERLSGPAYHFVNKTT